MEKETTLREVRGLIAQLMENMSGESRVKWVRATKLFLRGENPWPVATRATASEFALWRTISLGLHKTPAAYRVALKKAGFLIGDYADDILNKVSVVKKQCDVTLVMCSVANLGFTNATRYNVICARAKELGLELCPAEVGLALRLAYADQEKDDWFRIAMKPLANRGRSLDIFYLEHDGDGRWLRTNFGDPDSVWDPECRFVFRLPSPSASISP